MTNTTRPAEEKGGNGQDAVVAYIQRFGGNCRDCADENGVCPSSGLPCADSDKAIRHVLTALEYGTQHGYLPAAPGAAAAAPSQDAEDARAMAFANHLAEMFMRIPRFNYGYRSGEDRSLGPIPSAEGKYVLYSEVTGILLSAARLLKERAAARAAQAQRGTS